MYYLRFVKIAIVTLIIFLNPVAMAQTKDDNTIYMRELKKECDGVNGSACTALAIANANKSRNKIINVQPLKTACDSGQYEKCVELGDVYRNGRGGVPRDMIKATQFYNLACKGGFASGCQMLAIAYDLGNGVSQDQVKAATLYDRACELGLPDGCENLATAYRAGFGVPVDAVMVTKQLDRMCTLGDAKYCLELAKKNRFGTKEELDKSCIYLERAIVLNAKYKNEKQWVDHPKSCWEIHY